MSRDPFPFIRRCHCSCRNIESHDLHAGNIRGAVDEIASYRKRDKLSPFFGFLQAARLLIILAFSFVFCVMVMAIHFY